MAADPAFEAALSALLDGRRLHDADISAAGTPAALQPLRVVEAIARASRLAIFGEEDEDNSASITRWGDLEVGDEIGRGASGTVYRAWDTHLSREVALKLLASGDEGAEGEALEEGRLLARLRHPHIVRVYGADTHDGVAGVWMELVCGDTLDEVLERDGRFGVEEALLAGIELAGALSAVHAAGLLHRDVKARNVIRERGGRMLLMDLGAGRPLEERPVGDDGTGTPLYMAPEVLAGSAATERSDVYSLGVLLYRLVSGTYPVSAPGLAQLRAAHAAGQRTPIAAACPLLPPAAAQVIERACEADPVCRIASAAALERALRDALREAMSARALVKSVAARRWSRWKRTAAAAAAVVLVGTWSAWDTAPGRAGRRALGLQVPPRSPLYISLGGGIVIVDGRRNTVVPGNPAMALVIAVSSDLGVRTLAGVPPWTGGAAFTLDGRQVYAPRAATEGVCCFYDGTTDGRFNYSVRQDSTLLEPIGSRPLAPSALYRFSLDWSDPQPLFHLTPAGHYGGVSYSGASGTFWMSRNDAGVAVVEQWSRDGRLVSVPVRAVSPLTGLAVDARDDTIWVMRQQPSAKVIDLENYDRSGHWLGAYELTTPMPFLDAGGAEFAWPGRQ